MLARLLGRWLFFVFVFIYRVRAYFWKIFFFPLLNEFRHPRDLKLTIFRRGTLCKRVSLFALCIYSVYCRIALKVASTHHITPPRRNDPRANFLPKQGP